MIARLLAALVTLFLSLAVFVAPAVATFPGKNGRIAFTHDERAIWTVDPRTGDASKLTDERRYFPTEPSWSADGKRLLYRHYNRYVVVGADGRNKREVDPDLFGLGAATLLPDGNKFTFVGRDPRDNYGLFTGPLRGDAFDLVTDDLFQIFTLDASPDGESVAVGDGGWRYGRLVLVDLETGESRVLLDTDFSYMSGKPSFSPDGESLLVTVTGRREQRAGIYTVDVETGDTERIMKFRWQMPVYSAIFSPDGKKIAWLKGNRIAIRRVEGGKVRLLDMGRIKPSGENLSWQAAPRR